MLAEILLVGCSVLGLPGDGFGTIAGTVVNASSGKRPVPRAEVVLRVRKGGELLPCGETLADAAGRFEFRDLPAGAAYVYVPGANRDGIHYPGPRVQFLPGQRQVTVELEVRDSVSAPSPLVIRRQDVTIRPSPGSVQVTESILIENPGETCYVGLPPPEGASPVTLQLAIPANFDRCTFQKEFFGRRFGVWEGRLATGIPWPPGKQEIQFTYVVPNEDRHYRWQRPLDLPCSELRVSVETDQSDEVSCNLPRQPAEASGAAVFQSAGPLAANYQVDVEIGKLPISPISYSRWYALAALAVSIAVGTAAVIGRKRAGKDPQPAGGPRRRGKKTAVAR